MLRFEIFLLATIALASGGIVRTKLQSVSGSPNGKCPETNGPYPVLLGDTEDCTAFYYCDWGRPILQHCPPGTIWSVAHRCDTNDKCENGQEKPKSQSVVGKCPAHDGEMPVYLPDDEDCSVFYECSNGRPIKLQCAPGDLFDAPSGRCVKNTDAQCQGNSSTEAKLVGQGVILSDPVPIVPKKTIKSTETSHKPIPLSAVGECPEHPGTYPVYLPDSEDCTVFYECDWGRPIKQHCPPGTSWSISYNRCDTSEVDKCENAQNKTNARAAVGKCPAQDGEFPVYLPDDEDCSIFYECSNGRPIKLQCAPGDLFDAPSLKCVKNTDAQCQGNSNTETAQQAKPLSAVGECPERPGQYPVYLPDDEDCSVFYECSNGRPIKLKCAPGTLFDAPSRICVIPTDATCQNSSSGKKIKMPKPELKPKILTIVGECPNPSGSYPVYLPDDEDCSAFYECSNGIPIKLFCADGSLFDSVTRKCTFASEAKCQNTSN